jgi:hypothetical protein
MLKQELIKIKLRISILNHYLKLGYKIVNTKDEIEVYTKDIHKGSGAIVSVICDNCKKELKIKYKIYYESTIRNNSLLYYCKECKYCRIKKTNLEKYGVENVMLVNEISNKVSKTMKQNNKKTSKKERSNILKKHIIAKHGDLNNYYNLINEKKKKTCLDKYGVENVMLVDEIKKKGQITCLERYGQYNIMFIDKIVKKASKKANKTKIKRNLIISEDKLTEFEKYRKITRRLIYKYKKELFYNWNGYDYYDNEYIKDNLNLHYLDKKYPSIDHKISIFQGFTENIDPYVIGNIENLCITKREINSSKFIRIKPSQKYLKIK